MKSRIIKSMKKIAVCALAVGMLSSNTVQGNAEAAYVGSYKVTGNSSITSFKKAIAKTTSASVVACEVNSEVTIRTPINGRSYKEDGATRMGNAEVTITASGDDKIIRIDSSHLGAVNGKSTGSFKTSAKKN